MVYALSVHYGCCFVRCAAEAPCFDGGRHRISGVVCVGIVTDRQMAPYYFSVNLRVVLYCKVGTRPTKDVTGIQPRRAGMPICAVCAVLCIARDVVDY